MTADAEVGRLVRRRNEPLLMRGSMLGELAMIAVLLVAYDRVRSLASTRASVALSHGWAILDIERITHVSVELDLNAWLTRHDLMAALAVGYYQFLHLSVALAVLVACYVYRPDVYARARNALLLTNVAGLAVFALYPVAPPRLLPGAGFVDSVARAGFGSSHGPIPADQYGALPSLHLAWATWVAITGIAVVRRTVIRRILLIHPALTAAAVVASANHYELDVVAGVLLGIAATAATGLLALAVRPTDRDPARAAADRSPGLSVSSSPAPQRSDDRFTVVAFHAHPDDETLLTGGTLARLAAEGHRVVLVVATLGEAGLAAESQPRGSSLGQRRLAELRAAALSLGCDAVQWLGYGDSGMDADAPGRQRFSDVSVDDAADRLAQILRREHADVLTIYDAAGGYGHPDHVHVHAVGRRAAERAGTPVVLEATVDRRALLRLAHVIRVIPGLPPQFRPARLRRAFSPHRALTHRVDVREHLVAKRAAMAAHSSQRSGGSTPRSLTVFLRLPAPLFRLIFGHEWYIEHGRRPGPRLIDDVLASLRGRQP